MALHHAHRDAELLGDLFERALVLGHDYQYINLARGEAVVGDESLALFLDGGRGECFLGELLMFALLLGLG